MVRVVVPVRVRVAVRVLVRVIVHVLVRVIVRRSVIVRVLVDGDASPAPVAQLGAVGRADLPERAGRGALRAAHANAPRARVAQRRAASKKLAGSAIPRPAMSSAVP